MQYFDPDADEATEDLFAKFAWFIKEVPFWNVNKKRKIFKVNKDPMSVQNELAKIDKHMLANKKAKFLTGLLQFVQFYPEF